MRRNKTTVSSYILEFLASKGIGHVFGITGGAIAFVIDEFARNKNIKFIPVAHEQAAAMAADAYARVHKSGVGATMATSGPGATNLITGIACSYFDSIPTIHITGQVNVFDQVQEENGRQVGFQETNIVDMVEPITKYAVQVKKAQDIFYELEKAYKIATTGRKGPVLLDIPQNIQREEIELPALSEKEDEDSEYYGEPKEKIIELIDKLNECKRPVILIGNGVRLSGADKELDLFLSKLEIPVVTSWSAQDLIWDKTNYFGSIGVYGDRAANKIIQNADLIISIGSRLDTRQVTNNHESFGKNAYICSVDIDYGELHKGRPRIDLPICMDAKVFMKTFLSMYKLLTIKQEDDSTEWIATCLIWEDELREDYSKMPAIYRLMNNMQVQLKENDLLIPDDGGNLVWTLQTYPQGHRVFSAFGNSPMGYALPASIGAQIANPKKRVICVTGDGSMQINIQELQTIVANKLPIKIFIINNNGYGIIKQFQKTWLGGRYVATGKKWGVTNPNFRRIAKAYGFKYLSVRGEKYSSRVFKKVLSCREPIICEIFIPEFTPLVPKVDYGNSLENMTPALQ